MVQIQTAGQFLVLLGKPLALLAAVSFVVGCVVMWHAVTRDQASGTWKHGLISGTIMMAVPTIMTVLAFMFWGQIGPVLNWG